MLVSPNHCSEASYETMYYKCTKREIDRNEGPLGLLVIRVAVNDRVKKIAELACSLPSADDHVEAAEAIIKSEEARS